MQAFAMARCSVSAAVRRYSLPSATAQEEKGHWLGWGNTKSEPVGPCCVAQITSVTVFVILCPAF